MKILQTVLIAMLLLSTAYVKAQTADDIINKHIAAIGGKDVINNIKSQILECELSVMGSTLTNTTIFVVGKGLKSISEFHDREIIQCITPTGGWSLNQLQGMMEAQPLPEDQVKAAQRNLTIGGELFNYKEKGSKVELVGNDKVEGVNVVKLKLTDNEGKEKFLYIDAATHFLLRQESINNVKGEDITVTNTFSNFKKTDIGFFMPFTTITDQGYEITTTIKKVEFNKEIDPKIFEMPK